MLAVHRGRAARHPHSASNYVARRIVDRTHNSDFGAQSCMTTSTVLPADLQYSQALHLAIAAYLARFKSTSRTHAESDLRAYLGWCADRGLDPLAASRPQIELYVRWMQEVRRLKPSTVSRRMSIVAGFYRTAVIDGLLEHSPAEHARRPTVPAESPTLGLTHLQLEALLTAARHSHRTDTTSPWSASSDCSACGSSKPPA
jgi:integrase